MSILVFLVDQNPNHLKEMEEMFLEFPGFELMVFDNPRNCIINLDLEPDIVILNDSVYKTSLYTTHNTPEIIKILNKRRPSIPVIITSENSSNSDIYQCIVLGAKDYITKEGNFAVKLKNAIEEEMELVEILS